MSLRTHLPKGWKEPDFSQKPQIWFRQDLKTISRAREQRGHAPQLMEWGHIYIHTPYTLRLDELTRTYPYALARIKRITAESSREFAIWLTPHSYYDQLRIMSGFYAYDREAFRDYICRWQPKYAAGWRRRMIRYVLRFEDPAILLDMPLFTPRVPDFYRLSVQ